MKYIYIYNALSLGFARARQHSCVLSLIQYCRFISTQRFFTRLTYSATFWLFRRPAARLLGRPLLFGRGGGRGVLQEGLLAVPGQGRPEVPELSDDSVGEL